MMDIKVIACVDSRNFGIGLKGKLLYRIPEDLARFKVLTEGNPIIMGRKTFESLGRTLPNRKHFILSRNPAYRLPQWAIPSICTTVGSFEMALKFASLHSSRCAVIGGEAVYRIAMPVCSEIHLTVAYSPKVDAICDAFFPEIDQSQFDSKIETSKRYESISYHFMTFTRKQKERR